MEEQRRVIEKLQRDNEALQEIRRSKDEAISRLLRDLKASEEARGQVQINDYTTVAHVTLRELQLFDQGAGTNH